MGGSGPGIAGLPLTVVWAAGSVVDIAEEVFQGYGLRECVASSRGTERCISTLVLELSRCVCAGRDIGIMGVVQKGGYVAFTAGGQIVGAVGKTVGSLLLWTPPYREDTISDTAAMARYIARPDHAPEALYRCIAEPIKGIVSSLLGLYLDPVAGALEYGAHLQSAAGRLYCSS
jgi:hypothetical protein